MSTNHKNRNLPITFKAIFFKGYYTPRNEVRGVYWNHPVRPSVCPSVDARAVR